MTATNIIIDETDVIIDEKDENIYFELLMWRYDR